MFDRILEKLHMSRQFVAYAFWGVVNTVFGYVLFVALIEFGAVYAAANVVSSIATKVTLFATNKLFVFKTGNNGFIGVMRELGKYIVAKSVVFAIDFFALILLVEAMNIDAKISKIFLLIVCTLISYIFSMLFVFKKKKGGGEQ